MGDFTMTTKRKKSVILFNATGLTGIQKNDLTHSLAKQCRQDNYSVSRIFYYQDYCNHATLYKLTEFVSRTREKVTVIFNKDSTPTPSNLLIYSVLSTLAISGHIELCIYQEQITLQQIEEHELKLMQQAVNCGQLLSCA